MSLSKRHDYVQVLLQTIDHLWYHQVTGFVVLQNKNKNKCQLRMQIQRGKLKCRIKRQSSIRRAGFQISKIVEKKIQTQKYIIQQNRLINNLIPSSTYSHKGSATAPPLPRCTVHSEEVSRGSLFLLKNKKQLVNNTLGAT